MNETKMDLLPSRSATVRGKNAVRYVRLGDLS